MRYLPCNPRRAIEESRFVHYVQRTGFTPTNVPKLKYCVTILDQTYWLYCTLFILEDSPLYPAEQPIVPRGKGIHVPLNYNIAIAGCLRQCPFDWSLLTSQLTGHFWSMTTNTDVNAGDI